MKKMFILCFLTLMLILAVAKSPALANPLLSSSKIQHRKIISQPPLKAWLMHKIVPIQRKLNKELARLTQKAKTDKRTIFVIIFFSFIYGLVHSLGPGHGKIIMSSFFLSKKSKLKEGILSGFIVGLTHGTAAIVLISVIYLIINFSVFRTFQNTSKIIAIVSYSVLIGIGLILFFKAFMSFFSKKHKALSQQHSHESGSKITSAIPISFAAGLVPCPGAATVIIFSISTGVFAIGVLSVVAMSVAMALVISAFTVFAVFAQKSILHVLSQKQALQFYIFQGLRLLGSLVIICMGVLLMLMNISFS